jgi:DNA polymerase-1
MWHALDRPRVHVCWEGDENWRYTVYPEYKAGRNKNLREDATFDTVAAVDDQWPRLVAILDAAGVSQWACSSGECDDVLYTLSQNFEDLGEYSAILTQDRDLYQAVTDFCCVVRATKEDEWEVIDRARVFADMGVLPEDLPEMKALAGDSSDNIPGVKGIGPKNASKLIGIHDNLIGVIKAASHPKVWGGTEKQRLAVLDVASDLHVFFDVVRLRRSILLRRSLGLPDPDQVQTLLEDDMILSLASPAELQSICSLGSPSPRIVTQ